MQSQHVRENLNSGIPELDQKNKIIQDKILSLIEMLRRERRLNGNIHLLTQAAEEVEHYFRFEESFLQEMLNPIDFSDHRERHNFFVNFLRSPVLDKHYDKEELCDFIGDWFLFHISCLDKNAFQSSSICMGPE